MILLFFPEISESTVIDHTFTAGLFFARFKELKIGKTQHRKKQRKANFSKKLQVPESYQYFSQKPQDSCHYKGPILIDF